MALATRPTDEGSLVVHDGSDEIVLHAGHLVLPVSSLKNESRLVFDALTAGKTVYVSKHGKICAAFRPYEAIPEGVAAAYASPGAPSLHMPEVTARDFGRSVPSKAVSDAAAGLPSLITKDRRLYGMLTAASTPRVDQAPDREQAAARAEAVRAYLDQHPEATTEDVVDFTSAQWPDRDQDAKALLLHEAMPQWDTQNEAGGPELGLDSWRALESPVEDAIEQILLNVRRSEVLGGKLMDAISSQVRTVGLPSEVTSVLERTHASEVATLREGERFEAADDVVQARTSYFAALCADERPSTAAMWRLADLSRNHGHAHEASAWYQLALTSEAIHS